MSSAPWLDGDRDSFPSTYILACTETGETQRLSGYDCEFATLFLERAEGDNTWFWNTFAKPIESEKRVQRHQPMGNLNSSSTLERLPNELFEFILDALIQDRIAVLALGLASPILYPKILARIHRDYAHNRSSSWADKKAGFYGGNSPVSPHNVLTFEREWFTPATIIYEPWEPDWQPISMEPEQAWRESLIIARSRWEDAENSIWRNIDRDLSEAYMYPQDRVWVLRNLTTQQYVRSDALFPPAAILEDKLLPLRYVRHTLKHSNKVYDPLKSMKISPRVRALDALTLPTIFLILTAHTSHPDWREEDIGFRCGPWVSHAFEVVPLEDHLESAILKWQDVTAAVAADVGHLRWCIMQRNALLQPPSEGKWERMKEFSKLAPKARARWNQWAQNANIEEAAFDEECA